MTFQHFLPASYIGRFSTDADRRHRERRVFMRSDAKAYERPVKAKTLAGAKGFYRCDDVDAQWELLERALTPAIDELSTNPAPDLNAWLAVAGFISDLFLRGPDFDRRFLARSSNKPEGLSDEELHELSHHRLYERYLNIGCILRAEWFVQDVPDGLRYITSDRGFAVMKWESGVFGYVVPLSPTRLVKIRRTETDQVKLLFEADHWSVQRIWHTDVPPSEREVGNVNRAMWQFAFEQVYGAEFDDVASLDPSQRSLGQADGDAYVDGANRLLTYSEERLDHVGAFDFLVGLSQSGWYRPAEVYVRDIYNLIHACQPGTFSAHGNPYDNRLRWRSDAT